MKSGNSPFISEMSSSADYQERLSAPETKLFLKFITIEAPEDEPPPTCEFVQDSLDYVSLLPGEDYKKHSYVTLLDTACEAFDRFKPSDSRTQENAFMAYGIPNEYLGAGAFGSVYRSSTEEYALKYCESRTYSHARAVLQEFAITKILKINGVVKSVDILVHKENKYKMAIVQKYIEGGSLHYAIRSLDCFDDPRFVDKLFKRMLEIVSKVHRAGFFHNDIKPGNFVFNSDTGAIHLVDFGLSIPLLLQTTPDFTQKMLHTGSRPYFPVERLRCCNHLISDETLERLGQAKDSWALGLTFYEMMTRGKRFWNSASIRCQPFYEYFRSHVLIQYFYSFPLHEGSHIETSSWMFRNLTLHKLLDLDNSQRWTATDILRETYLQQYFDSLDTE